MTNIEFILRWLCEQLVREILWGAWRFVVARSGAAQDRAFLRFQALVDAAPCWPCRIDYMHPAAMHERAMAGMACWPCLCITTGADDDFLGDLDL